MLGIAANEEIVTISIPSLIAIAALLLGGGGAFGLFRWWRERQVPGPEAQAQANEAQAALITANTDQWQKLYDAMNTRVGDLETQLASLRLELQYLHVVKMIGDNHQNVLEAYIYRRGEPPPPSRPAVPDFETWKKNLTV